MVNKRTTGRRDLDDDQKARLASAIEALRDKLVSDGKDSTQEAIAGLLGSERSTIAKALRAKAGSIGLAVATARALGQHVSTILGEDWAEAAVEDDGPRSERDRTIGAIEREWRDDGASEEAVMLWRSRIDQFTSSSKAPRITEAVRERDRIQGMIDSGLLTPAGCLAIMQASIEGLTPTPPPHDPDDPGPPKRKK